MPAPPAGEVPEVTYSCRPTRCPKLNVSPLDIRSEAKLAPNEVVGGVVAPEA